MRNITVFDFDGTLTKKDTLLEFIKFCKGKKAFIIGFLLYSPLLIAYKLKLYPNWKVKQKIFSYFFKGMKYDTFCNFGEEFALKINSFINKSIFERLKEHIAKGDDIYIVSASIEEWVLPWCKKSEIKNVLGTKIEVINGTITGAFKSKNCYGQEKVNRLLEKEPHRNEYFLTAYGDSRGDKEMLKFADKGFYIKDSLN